MEGGWLCYRGGKFMEDGWMNGVLGHFYALSRLNWVEFMEGEWSCYRGGHFNGGRMVMLQKWSLYWRENGHVTDVVSFMEGEWSFH